ncbi:MAG: HAD hydrolase-like protein [Clostridia bacterium]|nr:HAD hydrolase-like protein [Clostridia bacterium]
MIKAVFLDIDDTLLDFEAFARATMEEGFRRFHLPEYQPYMYAVFDRVSDVLWKRIERGEMQRSDLIDIRWQTIFAELGITCDARAFEEYFLSQLPLSAIPVKGAGEIVSWLAPRCLLCAASNGIYDEQKGRLRRAGWLDRFHMLFISEDVGIQKPAPEFFARSIARLNAQPVPGYSFPVLPREILMVGDSLTSDMRGGIGSGLRTCFFDRQRKGIPQEMPIDYCISDLSELKRIITSLMQEEA